MVQERTYQVIIYDNGYGPQAETYIVEAKTEHEALMKLYSHWGGLNNSTLGDFTEFQQDYYAIFEFAGRFHVIRDWATTHITPEDEP